MARTNTMAECQPEAIETTTFIVQRPARPGSFGCRLAPTAAPPRRLQANAMSFGGGFRSLSLSWILLLTCGTLVIRRLSRAILSKLENNQETTDARWRSELAEYWTEASCDVAELSEWRRCTWLANENATSLLTFTPIGRTGNRMYEYAGTVGLAVRRGMVPSLPRDAGLGTCFRLNDELYLPDGDREFVEGHPPDLHYAETWSGSGRRANIRLSSLLQSWKYFGHVDEMLRNLFEFRSGAIEAADDFLRSGTVRSGWLAGDHVYVSVHVRRTDFVDTYGSLIKPISASYVREAMTMFRNVYHQTVRFVVVSDDPEWCKSNVNITARDLLSENRDPCHDLAILSRCNHSIITSGSSFSWWGAFLANGHVTYYPGWLKTGSWYNLKYVESDFFLPRWKKLDF